ncbi:hypothetical protein I203_101326 [Kwoniella mangroviensis CBS 8507]|uniref:uncharacterized protein n=1 Tax=Kwoniella mangroviensis CBS 8507 TaxID=1296122 RepID=UPI00080CE9B3|nr:uncharacterized protein I203_02965 [Kwoniella mangroviensis CBS 8507]OCF68298.1 hypothetical protein I203_02965 [Kwoniella mangroviensis CBS 8507]
MSPGLLDSEFTSQHTSSFTPPVSFPIVPGLGSSSPSSPSPSSGITKHPHVWDLPSNTNGFKPIYYSHEVIPIVNPTLDPVDPVDLANMVPPPNGIVNPNPNIRRSSDPTPMSTSHGVALGHYHLLPPIELTGTGSGTSQWPKAKPNGPRPQSRTRTTRPKASFYILDNDNEQDEDRYTNNSNQSSTLYHSNSSRKRSIEGYAISHAHAHGQEQPMQFRVANPDRSSSSTLSSTSDHLDDNEVEVHDRETDDTRRGSMYLDGGVSEMDEEELGVRLAQYNMIAGYNQTPGTGDETDRDIRGRRTSLIDRAKTFMLRRNKDEIGTDNPYNEAGLQNGTILDGQPRRASRSWLRWRKSDSEDRRRAASEDWTRNHMARHERIRQGSSSTANTHPRSSARQKRMVNPYPKMTFELGLNPKGKSDTYMKNFTNTNNQVHVNSDEAEAWDGGLPPQRPATTGQSSSYKAEPQLMVKKKSSKGWKGKFKLLKLSQ